MRPSLNELFEKYKGNTCFDGTDKTTTHSYGDTYTSVFNQITSDAPSILEIGIAGGFGIQVYSEYFPKGIIYGMDMCDAVKPHIKKLPNVKLHFGDATQQSTVNHFGVLYDLIIEDASHLPEHQIQHFADFCKLVKPGGYYVMEDLDQNHFENVKTATAAIAAANGLTQTVHDLRRVKGRFDDIMLVFKKE